MKHFSGQIAHGYPAVNEVASFRGAEQLPLLGAELFSTKIAIRISAGGKPGPAVPSAVVNRLLSAEYRGEIFFHGGCGRRLDYAADLAAAALDDHGRNVGDAQRLNRAHRFPKLIVDRDELELNLRVVGSAQGFDQPRNIVLAIRAPGSKRERQRRVFIDCLERADRLSVRLIVLH